MAALADASKFRGIYSRVAKKLGLSVQHVREVALGRRHSARVARALDREFLKIRNNRERAA